MTERRDQPVWARLWDESARAAFTERLPPCHEFPEPDPERWFALIDDPGVSMLMRLRRWARSAASSSPRIVGARVWAAR